MKKIIIIFFIFISFKLLSQENVKEWSYSKKIENSGTNKYKYFFIDKDIYRYSNGDLSDLRIVDEINNFIPYYINEGFKEEKEEYITFSARLIKKSVEKIKDTAITNTIFDFQVFYEKDNYGVNKVEIEVSADKEFSNQIEIYGREEKSDWTFITKDTIYNINQYKKNSFDFNSVTDDKFFRIVMLDNKDNIDIKNLIPLLNIKEMKYNSYKEGTELKFEIKNEKDISKILIKNPDNLKLMDISITVQGNFNRKYELQKKDDLNNSSGNIYISSGNLYNFEHNDIKISNKKIDLSSVYSKEDEFILNIINNNDPPLKITKISAVYITDKVIFENSEKKNLKVLFGNTQALKPSYDIISFKKYIDEDVMDKLNLSEFSVLKKAVEQKEKFNYKIIFNIIIFIVSLSLIIMLVKILKKK